ncbi:hypothetical protein FACS189451_04750 [Bacteroidia bacterium]|nr:hypothetical protein FACS189451_04750 [Bacteroidia bacterium]
MIEIDFKSWAELLEKIIFIIPELKKRKMERLRVEAEIDKIKIEVCDFGKQER